MIRDWAIVSSSWINENAKCTKKHVLIAFKPELQFLLILEYWNGKNADPVI